MLLLKDIKKDYVMGTETVNALKGVSLSFRKSEFVSILGQSGCGKTTMLNIIGGLDRYTSGDLIINGTSTKDYNDRDWDTYRNHSIGFVFQSYNLIPHLTIIENVALALTIGGLEYSKRKERAKEVLIKVGLEDKLTKKPNELSGGQMQRVAIARALVNEPDIILADEPTGALDSETSVQIMELLKEIAKDKLVIMVTHNPELAYKYSTRIIKMLDGVVIDDTNPCEESIETNKKIDQYKENLKRKKKYSSMSFLTAIKLSALNLLSKKRRTLITSLAAGIGIMGIAIILSVSNGMQNYIDNTMMDSASFNYISISATSTKLPDMGSMTPGNMNSSTLPEYPENTTGIYPYEEKTLETRKQKLDNGFISYLEEKTNGIIIDIAYSYNVNLNILTKVNDTYKQVSSSSFHETLSNAEYVAKYYTVLAKTEGANVVPVNANEVTLVVDKYNRLSTATLDALGISYSEDLSEIKYEELLGKEFRVVFNDAWYSEVETNGSIVYQEANKTNYGEIYANGEGVTLVITSILRAEKDAPATWLSTGINYSPELTKLVLENSKDSKVAIAQAASKEINVTTGKEFKNVGGALGGLGSLIGTTVTYESMLEKLGYTQTPTSITIYPTNVENRKAIISILDSWNAVKEIEDEEAVVEYIDMSSIMTSMLSSIVDVVTYVLMAFSITSLVISSIMIAIIIYASVIERTKEIGVLRSLGARKKDVGRIFEAEAILIGLISGVLAILTTLLVNVIINMILDNLLGVNTIANLELGTAIGLILLSATLLLIASLIPAGIASKKEPAVALRTE